MFKVNVMDLPYSYNFRGGSRVGGGGGGGGGGGDFGG